MSNSQLSLSGLARRLDLSLPRARTLRETGILVPNAQVGKIYLYDPLRIPELRIRVQAATERPRATTLSTSTI